MQLFHVSESANIERFDPRPASADAPVNGDCVWAVDEEHLPNYLLPRYCPRVCFARGETTLEEDAVKFLEYSNSRRVIAVEWGWLDRIRAKQLYIYCLPFESFECIDAGAGYFISYSSVIPKKVTAITDIFSELKNQQIELRFRLTFGYCMTLLRNRVLNFR